MLKNIKVVVKMKNLIWVEWAVRREKRQWHHRLSFLCAVMDTLAYVIIIKRSLLHVWQKSTRKRVDKRNFSFCILRNIEKFKLFWCCIISFVLPTLDQFFFRLINFVVILHKIPRHFERHDNDKKKMIYIYLLKKMKLNKVREKCKKKKQKRNEVI